MKLKTLQTFVYFIGRGHDYGAGAISDALVTKFLNIGTGPLEALAWLSGKQCNVLERHANLLTQLAFCRLTYWNFRSLYIYHPLASHQYLN